ncbi:type II toxin-antitoxin system HicB family antitoxin [Methanoregula sp.]|jgi:predicted RNase H-like HicB family nuclease|uniref:type II toxin-antitoxin system HicB family antitoxin n=1 Tax=Methanoregula sp. TaxID=2052170 RepID=UPI00356A7C70
MGEKCRGETREEALANIKEAIELVLEVRREELHKKTPAAREGRQGSDRGEKYDAEVWRPL